MTTQTEIPNSDRNGFEQYKQRLSAISAWKDGVNGCHRLDYRDLSEAEA